MWYVTPYLIYHTSLEVVLQIDYMLTITKEVVLHALNYEHHSNN